jgi:hypothetical protein
MADFVLNRSWSTCFLHDVNLCCIHLSVITTDECYMLPIVWGPLEYIENKFIYKYWTNPGGTQEFNEHRAELRIPCNYLKYIAELLVLHKFIYIL